MSEKYTTERPDWVPEDADAKFTTSVMGGIEGIKDLTVGNINPKLLNGTGMSHRKLVLSEDDYVEGVARGDRMTLSRAITLIESNSSKHFKRAQRVLQRLLPKTGNALRIGITGVPGAGKSTMIEAFGNMLCDAGHRVAVLTVDPTSSVTKGSILGDKTRMGTLSRRPEAFIRPSPAGGTLGGVARKSRETMLLCEAAGYDVYRGSLDDVLGRYYHCAQRYMPTHVVRLTGDCPVIDPHIVDRVTAQHAAERNDYTSTTERFPDGLDTEIMTYAALEKAYQKADLPSEREHVTLYIRRHPELFRVGTVDCAEDYGAMRWTVDEPQDFALIEKIYERLYPQYPDFTMEDILTLFREDETLAHINQGIMRNEGLKKSIADERVL